MRSSYTIRTSTAPLSRTTRPAGDAQPQLEKALSKRQAQSSISEQVKWILKRLLPGSHSDMTAVARKLGVSERTLQRPISEEGASFRQLFAEARQQLTRQYLTQPAIEMNEIAYLLGYEDPNSFYRAFRAWEGTAPAPWRSVQQVAH